MKNQQNKNSKVDNDHKCGWSNEREMYHDKSRTQLKVESLESEADDGCD